MAVSKAEADPRVLIREGDMSSFQVIVVTLCVLICALMASTCWWSPLRRLPS